MAIRNKSKCNIRIAFFKTFIRWQILKNVSPIKLPTSFMDGPYAIPRRLKCCKRKHVIESVQALCSRLVIQTKAVMPESGGPRLPLPPLPCQNLGDGPSPPPIFERSVNQGKGGSFCLPLPFTVGTFKFFTPSGITQNRLEQGALREIL